MKKKQKLSLLILIIFIAIIFLCTIILIKQKSVKENTKKDLAKDEEKLVLQNDIKEDTNEANFQTDLEKEEDLQIALETDIKENFENSENVEKHNVSKQIEKISNNKENVKTKQVVENKKKQVNIIKQAPENKKEIVDLINISELSDKFMENYFEASKKLSESDNKENILIAISKEKIENVYGAVNIVEAPNNQYILQYENQEQKENAKNNLKENNSVISVEENDYYTIDSDYNSWGIEATALDYAMENTNGKDLEDIIVAIIDSGVDMELANKYYPGKIYETYNAITKSETEMTDELGHGTHIFGTIAEGTPNNVKILPVKADNSNLKFDMATIIAAINYVNYQKKADVINLSLGGDKYQEALYQVIEAARQNNIICVASAGNKNTDTGHYPADFNNTISVASVDSNFIKATSSNFGDKINFAATGVKVKSIMGKNTKTAIKHGNIDNDDDHETISGTSMATPHVVCNVAMLKSYNKNITLEDTIELLKECAIDLGEEGWDRYYGYGIVSFYNVTFAEGKTTDKSKILKKNSKNDILKIEVPNIEFTTENYGSIDNLSNTIIRLYLTDKIFKSVKLQDLEKEGLEVLNYNPYSKEEQEIQIKYKQLSINKIIQNPNEYIEQENGNVSKVTPVFTIPQGLTANIGQKLSEIELPNGFEWMEPEKEIEEQGEKIYKAKFIPEDNINYEIVENIDIIVLVNALIYGDSNSDGIVDGKDLIRISKYLKGKCELSNTEKIASDVNLDKELTLADYIMLQYYMTGYEIIIPTKIIYGDSNGDGIVDGKDLIRISKYLKGKYNLSDIEKLASDVNLDGEVDELDVQFMKEKLAGND